MYLKIFILSLFMAVGYFFYRNFDATFSQNTEPAAADLIVCLAFSDNRVDRAVSLLNEGYGKKIVATTIQTYAALQQRQVRKDQLILLTPDAQTTYQEGILLRNYLKNSTAKKILVVSDAIHLFRVQWTMNHFFKEGLYHFSFISSESPRDSSVQWGDVLRLKVILYEAPAVFYYWFVHGVLGIEDNPLWIDTAKKSRFLKWQDNIQHLDTSTKHSAKSF